MATKQINVNESELAALMDDLEAMLEVEDAVSEDTAAELSSHESFSPPIIQKTESGAFGSPTVVPVAGPVVTGTVTAPPAPVPASISFEQITAPIAAVIDEHVVTMPAPPPKPAPTDPKTGLSHFVDPEEFRRDIKVDETNLDQAMMDQASKRAYYGTQAAYAEGQAARLKAKFEILEAQLYDEHQKKLVAAGEKATQNQIDSAVKRDPRWFAAKNKLIEAETIANVNRGLTFALADRRDMLIQLGSDRRQEKQGELRILDDRAKSVGQRVMGGQA